MATRLISLSILIVSAYFIYFNGLFGPLVFDDLDNLAPLNEWLNGNQPWQWVVFGNSSGLFGRPVAMATFVFNVWLLGADIWSLKFGNLVLHCLNGALVYRLFSILLPALRRKDGTTNTASWVALFATAVWMLHPLLVSTVLYVVQRMAMLSALFSLLAVIAFLQGRLALRNGRRRSALAWLLLCLPLSTLLAVFSKENGVLVPALCGLLEWLVFQPRQGETRHRLSAIFIGATLIVPAVAAVLLTLLQLPLIVDGYVNRPFTLVERLLTQARVLWSYVFSFLLPVGPRLGLYHDDFPISKGLLEPASTAVALIAWLGVLVFVWRSRRTAPGLLLGVAWFVVAQALESSVFPLLMYFEHRNYLPSLGLVLSLISLVSLGSAHLAKYLHHPQQLARASALALLAVLATATWARAGVWGSKEALLVQGLQFHPDSRWLRIDYAQYLMDQSPPKLDQARDHVDALVASTDDSTRRMGSIWRVLIDCSAGAPTPQTYLEGAFGGHASLLEADMLVVLESLADGVRTAPCPGLNARALGDHFSQMADRFQLPAETYNLRRLRFSAAKLYATEGNIDLALAQAELADSGNQLDAPMAVFLAELYLATGRYVDAQVILDRVRGQLAEWDETGKQFVQGVQARLDDLTSR